MSFKRLYTALLSLVICFAFIAGCTKPEDPPVVNDPYTVVTAGAGDRVISVDRYMDKLKGGLAGTFVGVSYARPYEFNFRNWKDVNPVWRADNIKTAFNEDDIYLSLGALETLDKYGIDVTSRKAGIELYNKNYEFWDGSNNNVLIAGWAPPFAGYPKSGLNTTQPWPDSCSYMCGGAYAGFLSPGSLASTNYLAEKFAEIVCYGDGIYGTQFVGALMSEAFFEDDIRTVVEKALTALPEESWTRLCAEDAIANYDAGMTAEENCLAIHTKWVDDPYYNWTVWPYSSGSNPGSGILLDSKACAAFIVIGLLHGNGDIIESMRITTCCGSDTDSDAAQVGGMMAVIKGFSALPENFSSGINSNWKIKYTPYTFDSALETYRKVAEENILHIGGKVGYVDGVLSFVIPANTIAATPGKAQNSKTPDPMERMVYEDDEIDQMRLFLDPGFEQQSDNKNGSALGYGWSSNTPLKLRTSKYAEDAYEGLCIVTISNDDAAFADIYRGVDVRKNTVYKVSVYIKTDGAVADGAVKLSVENITGTSEIASVTSGAKSDWTKIEFEFNSGSNAGVRLKLGFSGGSGQKLKLDNFGFFVKQ